MQLLITPQTQSIAPKKQYKRIKYIALSFFVLSNICGFSQKKIDKLLKQHNTESIPYLTTEILKKEKSDVILLDAREQKEYQISHIKEAICVGYDFFNLDSITKTIPDKNSKIVVYCSVGIRSEDIAEKLKKAGYHNIYNLYGGIFEWKSNDNKVYNDKEQETDSIHTFSKGWSKWLRKGTKVYD